MIICVDLNMSDQGHVPFNTAMLTLFEKIFEEEEILYIAERRQINHIKAMSCCNNVRYLNKFYFTKGSKFNVILKEFIELVNFFKALCLYQKNNAKLFIVFSVFPLTHFIIKLLKPLLPNLRLLIILHGELEYMKEKKKPNIKFFGMILKKALKIQNDRNTKYLVLGKSISNNLLNYIKIEEESLLIINHPYHYCAISPSANYSFPLKFSTVGSAILRKKSHLIFQLGKDLEEKIDEKILELSIIGSIDKEVLSYMNSKVNKSISSGTVTRDIFEEQIKKIHYAIFFYDNDYYTMCASGAFFDAIKFEKPMISIKNDFFVHYFNVLGNIGYLCENYSALKDRIEWIICHQPRTEYEAQVKNIRKAKCYLSLDNIKNDLSDQIQAQFRL